MNSKENNYAIYLLVVYFFLNNVGLPNGVLYTSILSPIFYLWLKKRNEQNIILKFIIPYSFFVLIQYLVGIENIIDYINSSLLLFSMYIFVYFLCVYINKNNGLLFLLKNLNYILAINSILIVVSFLSFIINSESLLWSFVPISPNLPIIPRLKLLSYEPSVYAFLFIPVFFYYFMYLYFNNQTTIKWLVYSILPIALSFSMGAYLNIPLTILIFLFITIFINNKVNFAFHFSFKSLFLFILFIVIIIIFLPDNIFFRRVSAIVNGEDSSANGRLFESFYLALKIAEQKSVWFGVGAGQIKIVGKTIIQSFYEYNADPTTGEVQTARIPNCAAETLAMFGITGFIFRIFIELFLFFRTKVYSSSYRLILFIYIFIYQFTGSYVLSICEYVMWVLCFSSILPDEHFIKQSKKFINDQVNDRKNVNAKPEIMNI